MKILASLVLILTFVAQPARAEKLPPFKAESVMMEHLTSPEIRAAIAAGKTTVLVPTGGTEQNGPHLVLGKHNFTLGITTPMIAQKLGNTLIAPLIPVVPEGAVSPSEGNMQFTGTLSLRPETFAALLEDTARSLKQHGFKTICFVGEHGGSQLPQRQVAEKLSAEWEGEHVRVIHVSDYYGNNGQSEYLASIGEKDPDPQAHGGLADTSEMLLTYSGGVRRELIRNYSKDDWTKLGVEGPSDRATTALGVKLINLKVAAAVAQIQKERQK